MTRFRKVFSFWSLALAATTTVAASGATIRVVDMIPNPMSDETNGDTEPYIAVNPHTPSLMAATAFMSTPGGSSNGPLLVSTNGGLTWIARNIIPSSSGGLNTFDVTIHFNSAGSALYLGMLRDPTGRLEVARTTDMTLTTPMTVLESRPSPDQPYIAALTVNGGPDAGKDRTWVGNNDGSNSPRSATVDQSLDVGIAAPAFTQVRIDADSPVARDNYQVRPTAHADGHIYTAFYRRKGSITGGYNADVVVVRDDNWGIGGTPFTSVVDSVTTIAGENVAANTPISDTFGSSAALGNDWWGGDLYLTVDPTNSARVYISYSDSQTGAARTLHLRRSTDSGQTWGADLLTTASAKNAAIAVNSTGKIAYLYQSISGTSPVRWQTHLRRSNTGSSWDDVILADFPAPAGFRVLGDYLNLLSVGQNFYGVFSASNDLSSATFPQGVTWQRNKTAPGVVPPRFLGTNGVTTVAASVDPFFVEVRANACDNFPIFCNICQLIPEACFPIYDPWWRFKCPMCGIVILVNPGDLVSKVSVFDTRGRKVGVLKRLSQPVVERGVTYTYSIRLKPTTENVGYVLKAEDARGKKDFNPAYLIKTVEPAGAVH